MYLGEKKKDGLLYSDFFFYFIFWLNIHVFATILECLSTYAQDFFFHLHVGSHAIKPYQSDSQTAVLYHCFMDGVLGLLRDCCAECSSQATAGMQMCTETCGVSCL